MLGHRIVFQRRVITKEGGHIKQFYVGKNRQYICFGMDSTDCTSGITVRRHFVVATLSGIYHVDENEVRSLPMDMNLMDDTTRFWLGKIIKARFGISLNF